MKLLPEELRLLRGSAISHDVAAKQTFGKPSGSSRAAFSLIGLRNALECCHRRSSSLTHKGADAVDTDKTAAANSYSLQSAVIHQFIDLGLPNSYGRHRGAYGDCDGFH